MVIMSKVRRLLFGLHLFVGIGAMSGGLGAILNPENPMGVSTDFLKHSPFNNFLIPGIILFTVIGLGNVFSAVIMHYKVKFEGYICSIFSWALVIWIIVQCIMLNTIASLHVIFFLIGLVQAGLSMIIVFNEQLFPANVITSYYKKFSKQL